MTTDLIETADGILTLVRDGRKLVKVSFQHRSVINMDSSIFADCRDCTHCGTLLAEDDRGVWRDLADRFLCRRSPSAMHSPIAD